MRRRFQFASPHEDCAGVPCSYTPGTCLRVHGEIASQSRGDYFAFNPQWPLV